MKFLDTEHIFFSNFLVHFYAINIFSKVLAHLIIFKLPSLNWLFLIYPYLRNDPIVLFYTACNYSGWQFLLI